MRRAEVVGPCVDDVDLENDVVVVLGKGRRPRAIPYGHRTGQTLTRYLRARLKHTAKTTRTSRCFLAEFDMSAQGAVRTGPQVRVIEAGYRRFCCSCLR